jgi:pentafunctional AROM polypeptide
MAIEQTISELQIEDQKLLLDAISARYISGQKSYIIPLTFSDLNHVSHLLERIAYCGDCWELRVDLLCSTGNLSAINVPKLSYVERQLLILREHSKLPILFTIRTCSQGGRFPDGAEQDAFDLYRLAVDFGCEYIDVELKWPEPFIQKVIAQKGSTKIVGSQHDWTGSVRWTDPAVVDWSRAIERYAGELIPHRKAEFLMHLITIIEQILSS